METGTTESMKVEVVGAHPSTVTVTVNTKPVELPKHRVTGLEIKQAAIAQGVNIQPDFVLFRVKAHGKRDPIRDDEKVEPHRGDEFEAVPGDDNS
jgi:hypothetical protein